MLNCFITIRVIDIIDIIIVAFLMYQIYNLIKGTIAIYIFITIVIFWALWFIVKDNMLLLGSILGSIIGVGVIAIIVMFQPELRRFLILIGSKYLSKTGISLDNLLKTNLKINELPIDSIVKACINLSKNKIGGLIVLKRQIPIDTYVQTGDILDAKISNRLIETIFTRSSPLHDGAIIIVRDKIKAARCILPLSNNFELPAKYGLRHRAGIGLSEESDAIIIIISEETGELSLAEAGTITKIDTKILFRYLEKEFIQQRTNSD